MSEHHLIFLHGAMGCSAHWERFIPAFENRFEIHNLNFPGHGDNREILKNSTLDSLTEYVIKYINEYNIKNFRVIGYSMGGYVGLNLLLQNISGYRSLITLATKLAWNKTIAESECEKLTLENLAPIIEKLEKEHSTEPKQLIDISKEILISIGNNPLAIAQFSENTIPVSMLRGSKDRMVTEEEVIQFSNNMPNSVFEIIENQPHNLEKMDVEIITGACLRLLDK